MGLSKQQQHIVCGGNVLELFPTEIWFGLCAEIFTAPSSFAGFSFIHHQRFCDGLCFSQRRSTGFLTGWFSKGCSQKCVCWWLGFHPQEDITGLLIGAGILQGSSKLHQLLLIAPCPKFQDPDLGGFKQPYFLQTTLSELSEKLPSSKHLETECAEAGRSKKPTSHYFMHHQKLLCLFLVITATPKTKNS